MIFTTDQRVNTPRGKATIIGFEAYVAQGSSRFDKTKRTETSADVIDVENSDGLSVSNINYAHLITSYRIVQKTVLSFLWEYAA